MNRQHISTLQLALGAILISFSSVFVKLANMEPTAIGFYRMFIGGIILLAIALFNKHKFFFGRKHFLLIIVCAFIFAADLFCWHQSIKLVGPGLATLIAAFQVFILASIGIIFHKEKLTLKLALGIPAALFGLYLLVGIKWSQTGVDYKWGVLFGLITAVTYACYVLFLNKSQNFQNSKISNLALISLFCALFLGVITLIQKQSFMFADNTTLMAMISYGLVSQVIGWILIGNGIAKVPTSQIGLILLLQPIGSFLWDVIFFKRPTSGVEYLGLTIALIAIYLGSHARPVFAKATTRQATKPCQ
jgi:drug/metabolite transporter (DMT)-like permease